MLFVRCHIKTAGPISLILLYVLNCRNKDFVERKFEKIERKKCSHKYFEMYDRNRTFFCLQTVVIVYPNR